MKVQQLINSVLSNESNLVIPWINLDFFQCPGFIPDAPLIKIYHTKDFIISYLAFDNVIRLIYIIPSATLTDKVNPGIQIFLEVFILQHFWVIFHLINIQNGFRMIFRYICFSFCLFFCLLPDCCYVKTISKIQRPSRVADIRIFHNHIRSMIHDHRETFRSFRYSSISWAIKLELWVWRMS